MDPDHNEGIDASTFQPQLCALAKTVTHLLEREAAKERSLPNFVADDLAALLRMSFYIYAHLLYVYKNSYDSPDPDCLPEYGFVILPQIRILIDCLYNTVLLLEHPSRNGKSFRADGYRQLFESITEAEQGGRYSAEGTHYLVEMRRHYALSQRVDGISDKEIAEGSWPTFSGYLKHIDSDNADFLRRFSFGLWRQYSAISHCTFWGLTHVAPFLRRDRQLPENRVLFLEEGAKALSLHLLRASYVFLCILTEIEARLHLGDHARVRLRLTEVWHALARHTGDVHAEAKEVFESRYARLLLTSRSL